MNLFLLKSAGIIALFLVIYKLFLEHDTYFKSIRMYFVTGILASFILPFISITKYVLAPQTQQFVYSKDFQNFASTGSETPFNWTGFLFTIYIIGIALSGLYLIFQIVNLTKILNSKSVKEFKSYKIIETQKDVSPFSFFKYIVYNPAQFSKEEIQQLLKHEETHVLQRHSIDMLLAHMLTCVQWFNPFAWYYKKAITQNLEYIADKEAKFTIAPKNYSYLLLKTTKPNYQMVLANNFYNSLLKKRIMMLHKNHSPRLKQFKLALILPLLVGFVFAFNTKVVAQHKQDSKPKIENIDAFSIQFEKNATKSFLDKIKSTFKNMFDFDIKIKNLKRNDKNDITAIKIIASKGNFKTQYVITRSNAIQPIKIEYNGKSDKISISTGKDEHNKNRNYFSYKIENFTGDPQKLIKLQNSLMDDKDENDILLINDNDTIHKLKGNNFIVFSDKIKDKGQNTFMTKSKNKISKVVFIDDDGTKTNIIEVLTDEKLHKLHKKYKIIKNNSKSTWKDKDGNITKVIAVKTDKNGVITKTIEVVKIPEDIEVIDLKTDGKPTKSKMSFKIDKNGDIDASNHKKGFYFNTRDDNPPLFVIDGKVVKEGFMEKIDPESIKSISVLKGIKAINKYGRKGKNGVIEITLKKKK
ncbi:MAG: M56 family metallopeptidase [Flavobacteriaceae bacterium]